MSAPRTARNRKEREAKLPLWAHGMSTRPQMALLAALEWGDIADLDPATVCARGYRAWLMVPNQGEHSVGELLGCAQAAVAVAPVSVDGWE
jgi:hypothetical protein